MSEYFNWDKEGLCKCGCGMDVTLALKSRLEIARSVSKVPYVITSGARCTSHNNTIGGSPTSSHMNGTAVDIACTTSRERWDILNGLISAGFNRIGVDKTFIHADIDTSKVQNIMWTY